MKKLLILFVASLFACSSKEQPLETVANVDLKRYAGKWYEIASYPQRFQKGCTCTTAEYTPTNEGYIIVENACNKDSVNGEKSGIKGKAFIVENTGNAKLEVQFFWPFKGKYWIIDLDSNYTYAVVGHPNREYLWILSRTPQMEEKTYQEILERVKAKGFDLGMLQKTVQKAE